jgi:hypothetical protein
VAGCSTIVMRPVEMLVQPLRADAAEIVRTTRPLPVRPHRQGYRGDGQPEELSHPERFPQPPFVPRPMFRNPESGHEGSLSTTSGWTTVLPT